MIERLILLAPVFHQRNIWVSNCGGHSYFVSSASDHCSERPSIFLSILSFVNGISSSTKAIPNGNIQNPSIGRKPKMPPIIKPKPHRLLIPGGTRSFPHFSTRYDVLAISLFSRLLLERLALGIMRSLSRSLESDMGFED